VCGIEDAGCPIDTWTDPNNCGACGNVCDSTNATVGCDAGNCELISCAPNFGNCDGNPANACETDLLTTRDYCGSCTVNCGTLNTTASDCVDGGCVLQCASGFRNCNLDPSDGCEVNTNTSNLDCGTCGHMCVAGAPNCVAGTCSP